MEKITELAGLIARHARDPGISSSAIPRLTLIRADRSSAPVPAVYEASLCIIAQGSKRVSLADQSVVYDASSYLLVSVDLPLVGHVLEASPAAPYLCCKIDFDLAALADLLVTERRASYEKDLPVLAVYPSDPDLIDAASRLVKLLDRPETIDVLAPLIEREILYRLLIGPHGATLRQMGTVDSHLNQVSRAIAKIRNGFQAQLRIDEIAAASGMSASSLHAHFKAITRMTPLEYQKQLRLQEARRLMLADGANAGTAGFAVGYDSPSQFSREYRRLFGAPPRQDIERLQAMPDSAAAY
ncbi:AraC family transcriptional regulator [Mesorhizobium sp. CA8]|uniref:AraC family transcriptional regulator n=1 Tax=unclassified Mesorhizobium TaxID=325217 RepID=UPI001CCCBEAC|nr:MULTISPECIES: AraC family transcriptional regulator [unclassified Mesorhizobium]MBZ9764535.1 AraC family transcriptional regulator [Mesorhizobium sp. CA8]MBZ9821249.1 AraC family transcriptional regulator [Mesorhizobium sp. CA4]